MKLGRNDLCWCGSGVKYKRCHLNRVNMPRVSRQEALTAVKRAEKRRTCFHPAASPETCGEIIKAHSIQRAGGGLASIARDNHVYGYETGFAVHDKTGRHVAPKLFGVRDASTFTGFCNRHDAELFAPLDRHVLLPTAEQLVLLSFRAICRDLMAKQFALRANPFMRETGDRRLSLPEQLMWQSHMRSHYTGNELAIKDQEHARSGFEIALGSRDFSRVRAAVFRFDAIPAVAVSSPITPEFDFRGRKLQDLNDTTRLAEVATFSMQGTGDGRGIATFVWLDPGSVVDAFVNSVLSVRRESLPHLLVQFSFEYFENVFWSPSWWDGLDEPTRVTLVKRMNSQLYDRRPDCLFDDGTRPASWHVTEVARLGAAGWSV